MKARREEEEKQFLKAQEESLRMAKEQENKNRIKLLAEMMEPEPPVKPNVFTCVIRLTNGEKITRRFFVDSKLQLLKDFVDTKSLEGHLIPESYLFITDWPKRVEYRDMNMTFLQTGLDLAKNVLLRIESTTISAETMHDGGLRLSGPPQKSNS